MLIAADYPFLDVLWTMIIFFCWVAWIWTLIICFSDLFSRHDRSGWYKAIWMIFLILMPFLGVLIYLIANGQGMGERHVDARVPSRRSSTTTCSRSPPPAAPRARSRRPRSCSTAARSRRPSSTRSRPRHSPDHLATL